MYRSETAILDNRLQILPFILFREPVKVSYRSYFTLFCPAMLGFFGANPGTHDMNGRFFTVSASPDRFPVDVYVFPGVLKKNNDFP
jgi:hypothetical protein